MIDLGSAAPSTAIIGSCDPFFDMSGAPSAITGPLLVSWATLDGSTGFAPPALTVGSIYLNRYPFSGNTPSSAGRYIVIVTQGTDATGRSVVGTIVGEINVTASGNPAVNLDTIKGQAVACAAGVTVNPYVGSTGAAINGTNVNTLAGHDPGATLGTSTYAGGAVALTSAYDAAKTAASQSSVNAIPTNPYTGTPPTAAQIATAIFQDTTASDFTIAHSFGSMVLNVGSGVVAFTAAALANTAPASGLTDEEASQLAHLFDRFYRQNVRDYGTGTLKITHEDNSVTTLTVTETGNTTTISP